MKTAREINHVVGSFKTRLRAEIVTRQKTLQGAGLITVMLLYSLVGWSQVLPYGDAIGGFVDCPFGPTTSFKANGSAANDYNLVEQTEPVSCSMGGSGSADAAAHLGQSLNVATTATSAPPQNLVVTAVTSAVATDTITLIPPQGFTGRSITIGIMGLYSLSAKGKAPIFASACREWTGLSKPLCKTISRGMLTTPYSSKIVVKKTTQGFQFYVSLSGNVSVVGVNGGSASVAMGTPQIILPSKQWKYTWASGE